MSLRIKICGVRRASDAALAVELGATHVGCVIASDSPRCARLGEVREVCAAVAGSVPVVLVFRGARPAAVQAICSATGVTHVQLHGASETICRELEVRGAVVYRVHSVAPRAERLPAIMPRPTASRPAVLDVGRGGTGQRFAWQLLGGSAPAATFVAGGISAANVGALLVHAPFGIDVSSGVESAPGRKDPTALRRLFDALETAR